MENSWRVLLGRAAVLFFLVYCFYCRVFDELYFIPGFLSRFGVRIEKGGASELSRVTYTVIPSFNVKNLSTFSNPRSPGSYF